MKIEIKVQDNEQGRGVKLSPKWKRQMWPGQRNCSPNIPEKCVTSFTNAPQHN